MEHSGDKAVFVNTEYLKKQGKILAYFSTTDNYVTDEESGVRKEVWRDSTGSSLHFFANTEEYDGIRTFVEYMGRILICSPNPKMMQEQVDNDHYYPSFDFPNIASVYAGILPMQPEVFEDFRNVVRESDGAFKSTQVEMDGYRKYLAVEYVFDGKTCKLHFSELSDGEKMRFAMYLLLYGFIKQGMIVLLDEPDNYMSLKEIQPWCMELEEICEENGQCIMISHYAEVIVFLAADHGVWMSRLSSGEAVVTEDPYNDLEDAKMMPYSELMTRDIV